MVRGMYFKNPIKKGETINRSDVYFAIPYVDGHKHSGEFEEGLVTDKNYEADEAVSDIITTKITTKLKKKV